MKNRIYNEQNGLWYELQVDYYLPCLALPEGENQPVGIWGSDTYAILSNTTRFYMRTCLQVAN